MEETVDMSIGETVVQAQLRILVAILEMVRNVLPRMLAALPPSALEREPQADLDAEPDVTSELRRVIECVLADCLEPAIRDLRAAAEYRPAPVLEESDSPLSCPE
ncbi:MAG TPA: hypothetical protein VGS07_27955 [Thermoanaerobaculia bacterium]|jgi:hypothetical protein|nr:hypothetical protein [Thermoanaerobaculia bacterium]